MTTNPELLLWAKSTLERLFRPLLPQNVHKSLKTTHSPVCQAYARELVAPDAPSTVDWVMMEL